MSLLLLSFVALGLGPLLLRIGGAARWLTSFLDGFVLVSVAGLVLVHVLPHSVELAGWSTVPAIIGGAVFPTLVERVPSARGRFAQVLAVSFVLLGIAVHAFLDGTVMIEHHEGGSGIEHLLGLGVVLHRLPVGLAIVWLVRPRYGQRGALAVVAVLVVFSTLGFLAGASVLEGLAGRSLALFQAFVAGGLLHVVLHPTGAPEHDADDVTSREPLEGGERRVSHGAAAAGSMLGILVLVGLTLTHPVPLRAVGDLASGVTFLTLALQGAPALLAAYVLAAVGHALVPTSSRPLASEPTALAAARGALLGAALPVPSGGVPTWCRALAGRGAPAALLAALLVAASSLDLGSVLLSLRLLGPWLTALRLVMVTVAAMATGIVVARAFGAGAATRASRPPSAHETITEGFAARFRLGARRAFTTDVDSSAPWVLVGLVVAALAEPMLDASAFETLPPGVDVVLFALAGLPAYVSASGFTPVVAVLVHKGLSPGAALAFLLTGPAWSTTMASMLAGHAAPRAVGRRVAGAYAGTVLVSAIALGLGTNAVVGPTPALALHALAGEAATPLPVACLVLVGVLFVRSLLRQGPRAFLARILAPHAHRHGSTATPATHAPDLGRLPA